MKSAPFERLHVGGQGYAAGMLLLLLAEVAGTAPDRTQPTVEELERRLIELEAGYAVRHAALEREMEARLAELGARIAMLKAAEDVVSMPEPARPAARSKARSVAALDVAGDFRLRYEHTSSHAGGAARDRGVLRGRLGASYGLGERLTVGARLVTGDPDDPNSADATLGEFVDDLAVSLDQAYARYRVEDFEIVGGKFANPLARTELVWDGDVNPYGLAMRRTLYRGAGMGASVAGIYSIVDEQVAAQGGDMLGAQVSLAFEAADWRLGLDAAYYDYEIGSLLATDAGDIRGNNLTPDGNTYLSDFDLLDFVARVDYAGGPGGWPLGIVGDYVKNLGAAVPEDSGWSLELLVGELSEVGDWRFGYGYAVAETDAVLAAFSHDNTTYATNYREHTLTADYVLFGNTSLNLTGYLYRREDFAPTERSGGDDWVSRVRLNLQFSF